jgi:peptide chain release factor
MELQLSSGQGPVECELAVSKLLAALMEEFSDVTVLEKNAGREKNCFRSVRVACERDLSFLEGTVLWKCKSPFRPHHGRKNWFVDVSVCLEARVDEFDESLVSFETFRSGGHGGQNVNKVETGVRALYPPAGLAVICTEERSQYLNRRTALKRLREMLVAQNAGYEASAKSVNRLEHTRLERGNPVRIYEGMEFNRV